MALVTINNYVLLEEIAETSSQFGSKGDNANKYRVWSCDGLNIKRGATVYVLHTLGTVKIDGKEYTVAMNDEVVAYVA